MNIILSRKGFDDSNGGVPSPIFPNDTLLSFPIPGKPDAELNRYSDYQFLGINYKTLIDQLTDGKNNLDYCHLDPDIRNDIRINPISGWQAAYGQINSAQGTLQNVGVGKGDIFLFFGSFRRIDSFAGKYRFLKENDSKNPYDYKNLHMIYGYLQVGDILTNQDEIQKFWWHPHSHPNRLNTTNNVLYLPSKSLVINGINTGLPSYGTLKFKEDRVLTMKENILTKNINKKATWNEYEFLMPDKILDNRQNSAQNGGLYYRGIWQEMVIPTKGNDSLIPWVEQILV